MKMDFPQVDLPTEVLHSVSGENRKGMPLLCRLFRTLRRTNQPDEEYW